MAQRDLMVAQEHILSALPAVCAYAGEVGVALVSLLDMHAAAEAVTPDRKNAKVEVLKAQRSALQCLVRRVAARLKQAPGELSLDLLPRVLALPLDWVAAAHPLSDALATILSEETPSGSLIGAIRAAARLDKNAHPVVETLAKAELRGLSLAPAPVAANVLSALIEAGVLLEDVAASLPAMEALPLAEIVRLIAMLGEKRIDTEDLRAALESRVATAGPLLSVVPARLLVQLASAAKSSAAIEECGLSPVVVVATMSLVDWSPDDIAVMLRVVAKTEVGTASERARHFFDKAAEVLPPKLQYVSTDKLLDVVVALRTFEQCHVLFEASAGEAVSRVSKLALTHQMLLLTKGVVALGAKHKLVAEVADQWMQRLSAEVGGGVILPYIPTANGQDATSTSRTEATADDLARLLRLWAPVAAEHPDLFQKTGSRLSAIASTLTTSAKASLLAAFSNGSGPDFPGKKEILRSRSRSSPRVGLASAASGREADSGGHQTARGTERRFDRDNDRASSRDPGDHAPRSQRLATARCSRDDYEDSLSRADRAHREKRKETAHAGLRSLVESSRDPDDSRPRDRRRRYERGDTQADSERKYKDARRDDVDPRSDSRGRHGREQRATGRKGGDGR